MNWQCYGICNELNYVTCFLRYLIGNSVNSIKLSMTLVSADKLHVLLLLFTLSAIVSQSFIGQLYHSKIMDWT